MVFNDKDVRPNVRQPLDTVRVGCTVYEDARWRHIVHHQPNGVWVRVRGQRVPVRKQRGMISIGSTDVLRLQLRIRDSH